MPTAVGKLNRVRKRLKTMRRRSMGRLGRARAAGGGGVLGHLSRNKWTYGGTAASFGMYAAPGGQDILDSMAKEYNFGGAADAAFEDQLRNRNQVRRLQYMRQRQVAQYQQLVQANMQQIAQYQPHLFNELLVGQRLAEGTAVFGMVPQSDILMNVARNMAEGSYGNVINTNPLGGGGF